MRTIIQYKKLSLVIMAIGLIASCKKQDLPAKPEPSSFSAALKNNTIFPAAGGKDTVIVSGGTDGWWVTTPVNTWLVITKKYGSGDFKLPVSVNANTTGLAREINVSINPTFGLPPVTINIKQAN